MAQAQSEARFLNTIKYEEIPGTKYIRLLDDFIVYSAYIDRTIIAPKGFICDGESVFFKSSTEAGVIHDYLYRKGSVVWDLLKLKELPGVNRRQADGVFYEVSRLDKSTWLVSQAKWAFVRSVSWLYWHKHNVLDDVSAED